MGRIISRLNRRCFLIAGVLLILIASACSAFSVRQAQPVDATATAATTPRFASWSAPTPAFPQSRWSKSNWRR